MKKEDVSIGTVYTAKVSGRMARVRIDAENPRGGWDGTNLATERKVRIKTASRLRGVAPERTGRRRKRIVSLDQHEAEVAASQGAVPAAKPAKAPKASTAGAGGDTGQAGAPAGKRPSLVDAAVRVLGEAGQPLRCAEIVERAVAAGYWAPSREGKTPDRTLTAAILREISVKGEASRFERPARGVYGLKS